MSIARRFYLATFAILMQTFLITCVGDCHHPILIPKDFPGFCKKIETAQHSKDWLRICPELFGFVTKRLKRARSTNPRLNPKELDGFD